MISLKSLRLIENRDGLNTLPEGKLLINCINAHSYNIARKDGLFAEALVNGDVLIPDGASIVLACSWINAKSKPVERVAGWDLFSFEMSRLNEKSAIEGSGLKPVVMFVGSSEKVLGLIRKRAAADYPDLKIRTYSPPFKPELSDEDSQAIVKAINDANPDLLWFGMTAPKQEKWVYSHWDKLNIHCHCGTVGAVFDFYAGTVKRAPLWWQRHSLEWLHRLIADPRRMWRRYLIGNPLFLWNMLVNE